MTEQVNLRIHRTHVEREYGEIGKANPHKRKIEKKSIAPARLRRRLYLPQCVPTLDWVKLEIPDTRFTLLYFFSRNET